MGGSDAGDPVRARAAIDESMPEKFKFPRRAGTLSRCGLALSAGLSEDDRTLEAGEGLAR